jgi:hypothetical protein
VNTALLKISIVHKVSYAEVARLADLIEHEGHIVYNELNDLSEPIAKLIQSVHEAVIAEQVRRGIINDGEASMVIPRGRPLNAR